MRVDGGEVVRMLELAGDAHEIGQVEVTEPQRVDAGDRGNGLDVGQTFDRFDLRYHHRALVQRRHLGDDIAALVVVMRKSERRAAPSGGRIARAGDDVAAPRPRVPTIGTMMPIAPTSSARAMK